jgi:hypothetical protein
MATRPITMSTCCPMRDLERAVQEGARDAARAGWDRSMPILRAARESGVPERVVIGHDHQPRHGDGGRTRSRPFETCGTSGNRFGRSFSTRPMRSLCGRSSAFCQAAQLLFQSPPGDCALQAARSNSQARRAPLRPGRPRPGEIPGGDILPVISLKDSFRFSGLGPPGAHFGARLCVGKALRMS